MNLQFDFSEPPDPLYDFRSKHRKIVANLKNIFTCFPFRKTHGGFKLWMNNWKQLFLHVFEPSNKRYAEYQKFLRRICFLYQNGEISAETFSFLINRSIPYFEREDWMY